MEYPRGLQAHSLHMAYHQMTLRMCLQVTTAHDPEVPAGTPSMVALGDFQTSLPWVVVSLLVVMTHRKEAVVSHGEQLEAVQFYLVEQKRLSPSQCFRRKKECSCSNTGITKSSASGRTVQSSEGTVILYGYWIACTRDTHFVYCPYYPQSVLQVSRRFLGHLSGIADTEKLTDNILQRIHLLFSKSVGGVSSDLQMH